MSTLSERLADQVLSARLESVTEDALDYCRTLLLDIFGDAVAGASSPLAEALLKSAEAWGTSDEAAIWATNRRLPAVNAALVNAHRIHCMEFDPFHEVAVVHPGTVVVPTAIAAVERMVSAGHQITGRQLLEAIIVGIDTAVVVGAGATETLRFFRPATAGAFGGVAAMAVLQRWDVERLADGFGMVLGLVSGTMQAHEEGSSAMALIVGMNARAAVTACDLVDAPYHPPRKAFEGKFGFYSVIESGGTLELLHQVGTGEGVLGTSIKPYPTGRATHGTIHGLEEIAAGRHVTAETVERVVVKIPPLVASLVGRPARRGMSVNYARLCLPYLVARFLLDGRVNLKSFEPKRLQDDHAMTEARKVGIVVNDVGDPNAFNPHHVTVHFTDGTREHMEIANVKGSPACPLSRSEVEKKFANNVAYGPQAIPETRSSVLRRHVDNLLEAPDARPLIGALVQPSVGS